MCNSHVVASCAGSAGASSTTSSTSSSDMNSAERLLRLLPPAHGCDLIDCNEHETSAPEETAREADTQRLN